MAMFYAKYSRGKTDCITTFTKFEQGGLLSETCDNTEISKEYDDSSNLVPLISEEEIDTMSSGDEYDAERMSTDVLGDIRDGSQFHPRINNREAFYRIRYSFKQR